MGLQDVPNEIWLQILRYLPSEELASVSLTSTWLHEIVEPILYSNFIQKGRTAIPLLIRTILDQPHLGGQIKSIDLLDVRRTARRKQLDTQVLTSAYHQKIRPKIWEYVNIDEFKLCCQVKTIYIKPRQVTEEWCMNISDSMLNFESTASLLLLLLPNLEQLSVNNYEICQSTILNVLSVAAKIQRSERFDERLLLLSRLRTIRLNISDDYGLKMSASRMVKISDMLSLREFHCSGVRGDGKVPIEHEPNIRKLSLSNFQVPLSKLSMILPRYKHLRNLTIDFFGPMYEENVLTTIVRYLGPSDTTLEQLKICNIPHVDRVTTEEFPSFTSFARLRLIEIEADYLEHPGFTYSHLPTALVHLKLRNSDRKSTLRQLKLDDESLLGVPHLTKVDVFVRKGLHGLDIEVDLALLSDDFKRRGVTLRIDPPGFI